MFKSEVKVEGNHVKGSIKKGNKPHPTSPRPVIYNGETYFYYGDIAELLAKKKDSVCIWNANDIREFAAELIATADKVDELNGVMTVVREPRVQLAERREEF